MMWRWHFKNLNGYASKAGNYSKLDKGLIEEEMNVFCFEATRPAWKGVSFLPNEPPGIIRASDRARPGLRGASGPDLSWDQAALICYS